MKKIVSLALAVCMLLSLLPLLSFAEDTTRTETFSYTENFNGTADGTLPAGWFVQEIHGGKTAAVSDGALLIDGTGSDTGRTVVRMPVAYRYTTDFVYEADFTITAANNSGRWGSLIFRVGEGDDPAYNHMVVRQAATTANGVEFASWQGTWTVHNTGSYSQNISSSSYYRLRVEVSGNTVKEYINDTLVIESSTAYTSGGFGIGCAGCVVKIDNIKITGTMEVPFTTDGYYFKEDFSSPTSGWASDYRIGNCEPYATIGIAGGRMIIDSTNEQASSGGITTLFLPDRLNFIQDFVLEADFTILSTKDNDASRWGSVIYRAVGNGKTNQIEINKPYLQMAIRQNATASNGVEVAYMQSGFTVFATNAYSESIDAQKTYRLKIMVCGNRVVEFINDTRVVEYTGIATHRGTFGISAAGSKIAVDNITIAPITAADMPISLSAGYSTDVYEPTTGLIMAPTTVWQADERISAVINATKRPATVQAYVSESGEVFSMDKTVGFGSLEDFTGILKFRAIPAYYVDTEAAATVLSAFLRSYSIVDAFVWSDNPALVKAVHTANPHVKGVVEYPTITDRYDVVHNTNANLAKIAVVPQSYATGDNLRYWQERMITVWVKTENDTASVYTRINTGANGIVTEEYLPVIEAIESYSEKTMIRKAHTIGHRGMPQGTLNENFISSFTDAYNAGAEMFEIDIYLTSDNQLVVMHDETVDRTTNGTGDIRNYTLAQAMALTSKYNSAEHVPSLEQVFQAFKGKDIMLVVELKAGTEGLVPALATLVEKYDMHEQINVITFHPGHMAKMQEYLPGISRGYLNMVIPSAGNAAADLTTLYNTCGAGGWTCNPNFNNTPNAVLFEAAKHRGMTFWPWTFNDLGQYDQFTYLGIQGLTTDYSSRASHYYTHMTVNVGGTQMTTKEQFSADVTAYKKIGNGEAVYDAELVRLSGDLSLTVTNGLCKANGEGSGVFCFRKKAALSSGQTYWIYTEAFTVECYDTTRILSVSEKTVGDRATVTTKAVSRDSADIPLELIACSYDADGRLLSASVMSKTLSYGAVQSFEQTLLKPDNAASVALYVWRSDIKSMVPFDAVGRRTPTVEE